jgi:hypothetical protein
VLFGLNKKKKSIYSCFSSFKIPNLAINSTRINIPLLKLQEYILDLEQSQLLPFHFVLLDQNRIQ